MAWYIGSMPTVKDIKMVISQVCKDIGCLPGVNGVYLHGSFAQNIEKPDYVVKDVDVIASTVYDSGDLLAIDNTKNSALRINPSDLEDEGFNPDAISFTKRFLSFEKYNVDHWATSSDGRLLHWGTITDNQEDWAELHTKAEKHAEVSTGVKRSSLHKASDVKRKNWKTSYDSFMRQYLTDKTVGWCPSDHEVDDILSKARKII